MADIIVDDLVATDYDYLEYIGEAADLSSDLTTQYGMHTDGEYFYICDSTNYKVVVYDTDWTLQTLEFDCSDFSNYPNGVTILGDYLYVLDGYYSTGTIYTFDLDTGDRVSSIDLSDIGADGYFFGITTDGTYLYVGNWDSYVYKITSSGTLVESFSLSDLTESSMRDITYSDGNFFVLCSSNSESIYRYNEDWEVVDSDETGSLSSYDTQNTSITTEGSYIYVVGNINLTVTVLGLGDYVVDDEETVDVSDLSDFPTYPATTLDEAEELLVYSANQIHELINSDATESVATEDGDVPSIRKLIADNYYFQGPEDWAEGEYEDTFNNLRTYEDVWYYAPNATSTSTVYMDTTPTDDDNWKVYAESLGSYPLFVSHTDTPDDYSGYSGYSVFVNSAESALEFKLAAQLDAENEWTETQSYSVTPVFLDYLQFAYENLTTADDSTKTWGFLENTSESTNLGFRMYGDDSTDRISFMTDYGSSGTYTEHMCIVAETGYIGIGTYEPATELEVDGDVTISGTTYSDVEAEDVLINGASTTISGKTWSNGWLRIGTETTGIAIDSNEIYGSNDMTVGTLSGGLTLTAADSVTFEATVVFDYGVTMSSTLGVDGVLIASGGVTGDLTGNVTGNLTGDVTGDVTGNVTGNLTGDVTGDVTGNLTGDVTGDVTGDLTGEVTGDLTGDVTAETINSEEIIVDGLTRTIDETTWSNAWLQIGDEAGGIGLDPNEIWGTSETTIGTFAGALQLKPTDGVTITGDTTITGDLDLTGDVDITGDTVVTGDLDIYGLTTIVGTTIMSSSLTVAGEVNLNGAVNLSGAVEVTGSLVIADDDDNNLIRQASTSWKAGGSTSGYVKIATLIKDPSLNSCGCQLLITGSGGYGSASSIGSFYFQASTRDEDDGTVVMEAISLSGSIPEQTVFYSAENADDSDYVDVWMYYKSYAYGITINVLKYYGNVTIPNDVLTYEDSDDWDYTIISTMYPESPAAEVDVSSDFSWTGTHTFSEPMQGTTNSGMVWNEVTDSRVASTVYTNDNGYDILVYIYPSSLSSAQYIYVETYEGSGESLTFTLNGASGVAYGNVVTVPAGSEYYFSGTLVDWYEFY